MANPTDATGPTCPSCTAPSRDGLLCPADTGDLRTQLTAVPWLLDQLDVVLARQTRYALGGGGRVRGKDAEQPLPVHLAAGDVRRDLSRAVDALARELGSDRVPDLLQDARGALHTARAGHAQARAGGDPALAADWALRVADVEGFLQRLGSQVLTLAHGPRGRAAWILAGRLDAARALPDVAGHLTVLHRLHTKALRVIDRPVELIPLGECGATVQGQAMSGTPCGCACHAGGAYRPPCDITGGCGTVGCDGHGTRTVAAAVWRCDRRVYAEPGKAIASCSGCGAQHDVRRRRDDALADYEYIQGRPDFLARVMTAVGLPVSTASIRGWAYRDRDRPAAEGVLHPTWTDPDSGVHWYRLGDVVARREAAEQHKAAS